PIEPCERLHVSQNVFYVVYNVVNNPTAIPIGPARKLKRLARVRSAPPSPFLPRIPNTLDILKNSEPKGFNAFPTAPTNVPNMTMAGPKDRKSTRLNSSHVSISYA